MPFLTSVAALLSTAEVLPCHLYYAVAAVTTSFGVERRVKEGKAKVNVCVLHDKWSQISITLSTTICVHPLWHILKFFVQKFFENSCPIITILVT